MKGVSVSELGWSAAIREAVKRRGEADDRLARDGQVIFISPSTKQEDETDDHQR